MSRSPKSPQYGNAGDVEAMIRDVEAPVPPRVDRPSRSYVEGRGEGRITGPSATPNQLGDHARQRTPRFTEELRSGVNLGTPTENTKTRQENGRIAGR